MRNHSHSSALRLAAVGNTNAKLAVTSAARLVALGREGLFEVAAEVYGVGVAKVKKDLTDEEHWGEAQSNTCRNSACFGAN